MRQPGRAEALNDGDRKVTHEVEEYGWHVLGVFEDDEGPAFTYTIGLYHAFKHPEILLIGLDLHFMQQLLNDMGDEVKRGARYEAGREYEGIAANYKCSFQKIDRQFYGDYLGTAMGFYKGKASPALQCVYPDTSGRFPWDLDCDEELLRMQPLLIKSAA